jgi:hypothetical protein
VRRRWRLVGVEVTGAGHVGQHQDCLDCIPDILAVSEFFYMETSEMLGFKENDGGWKVDEKSN